MNSSNSEPDCSQPISSQLSESVVRDSCINELQDNDQEPSLPSVGPQPATLIASPLQPVLPPPLSQDSVDQEMEELIKETANEWFLHVRRVFERRVNEQCAHSGSQAPTSSSQLAHELSKVESLLRSWFAKFNKLHRTYERIANEPHDSGFPMFQTFVSSWEQLVQDEYRRLSDLRADLLLNGSAATATKDQISEE